MFRFLEIDIWEQKKYEMRTQTSVDNKVNDLGYEIKLENSVKDKKHCFSFLNKKWTKIYFILGEIFFLKFLKI